MMATMYEPPTIAQLKITILDTDPPIWRRLLVPRKTTLAELHHIIQAAFGWLDDHLHQFEIGGLRFGDPDMLNADAFDDDSRALPENDVRLFDFLSSPPPFLYLYDFGDDWHHRIENETLRLPEADRKYPACIDGARSRPPEDVGGVHGYAEFLDVLHDPNHPDHADMNRWAGRAFHPEKFDIAKTDRAVRSAVRAAKRRAALSRYD
nr:plasmid pRiA4b ORF-3 family protein [Azospirillum argentinense]